LLVLNKYIDSFGHWLGVLASLASFVLGLLMFIELLGRAEAERSVTNALFTWIHAGSYTVDMAFTFDPLSAVFVLLITGVGSLIHIYSVGYMAHDPRRRLFFAYLNLFIAAMLMLVLASDYVVEFLGCGGVALG